MQISQLVDQILKTQKSYSATFTPEMLKRRELVERDLKAAIGGVLSGADWAKDLKIDASSGKGNSAVIPWLRIYNPKQSISAQAGWYLVLLFSGDGESASLSLNLGVTNTATAEIPIKVKDARDRIAAANLTPNANLRLPEQDKISLNAIGNNLATLYERGNASAFEIKKNSEITDEDFKALLEHLARKLELMPELNSDTNLVPAQDELESFLTATNWTANLAAKVLASLSDKSPQIVLQGPPGTGKTFVAMELAKYILGPLDEDSAKDQIQIVQFHPSYGYEEFVEGLRPETNEAGNLQFAKVEGALVRLAKKTKADGKPRVMIIDEMNRANLPKVFGELMFLLEYRDKDISLMYHGDFSLPANLFIIGTMNTADRSIKSMDIALRRRFDFFEVKPSTDILKAHYKNRTNHLGTALFQGFEKLNARIEQDMGGSNYAVGHSYFMMDEMKKVDLRDVWELQIYPLLEDYFFDRPELAREYTFDAFWS